jgi:hypothetical protein
MIQQGFVSEHCLFHLHRRVGMKMEQTVCSETLEFQPQTPVNHPEEPILRFVGLTL